MAASHLGTRPILADHGRGRVDVLCSGRATVGQAQNAQMRAASRRSRDSGEGLWPVNQLQVWDAFAWTWLALAAMSTVYVAGDQFRGNPEATVMKWGWVFITLYMGPIGLLLYVL